MTTATAPIRPEALEALRALLGPGGFLEARPDVEPFLTDFRGLYRGSTPLVALPASTQQAAGLVRLCAAERIGIVPHGGNTSYCGGATPRESGREIVVSLRRMNRIRALDPQNYSVTVEAGCVLASLQEAAERAGRLFPMSLGSEGSCTIGGNLSTNAGGTAVLRYGMMRDLVLGLEVVLPDGRVLDQLRPRGRWGSSRRPASSCFRARRRMRQRSWPCPRRRRRSNCSRWCAARWATA